MTLKETDDSAHPLLNGEFEFLWELISMEVGRVAKDCVQIRLHRLQVMRRNV